MSMGVGHFSVGAAGAILVLAILGHDQMSDRNAAVVGISAVWAMLPDVDVLIPQLAPTDHTPLVNVFWFHYTLDTHPVLDSAAGSAGLVAAFLVVASLFLLAGPGGRRSRDEDNGR